MIESYLPTPPLNFHYEIEKVSKLITKVWLVHEENYDYACGKDVRTIYCFVKGSKNLTIHKPKNAKEPYVKKYCELDDLSSQSPYSLFIPNKTVLFD
jgi:hypothetical protein